MDYVIAAVISGVVALTVAFGGFLFGRRKNEADAADILTNIAMRLVDPLDARVDELEIANAALHAEMLEVKSENAALHRWSQILFAEVIENGGVPTPFSAMRFLNGDDQ